MIFALQTSGKYGGEPFLNSLLYIAVHGKPGDIIQMFDHRLGEEMLFEEFINTMDKIRPSLAGSELLPLMEWYFGHHNGEDMTILSNGLFYNDMLGPQDFDEFAAENMMPPVGHIQWFNPLLG